MRYLKDSSKTAIIYGEQRIDYHHLIAKVLAFATHAGGTDGDRAAIVLENRPEWPIAFLSTWQNRQIPVPMDMQSSPEELAFMMRDAGVKTIWCSAKTAENAQAALSMVPELNAQLLRVEDIPEPAETSETLQFRETADEEIGVIIYTSGTTGRPKGVILTSRTSASTRTRSPSTCQSTARTTSTWRSSPSTTCSRSRPRCSCPWPSTPPW